MKDGAVFCQRDRASCAAHRLEIWIAAASGDVIEDLPGQLEGRTELHQRLHLAQRGRHSRLRLRVHGTRAAQLHGGRLPAERAPEIDDPATAKAHREVLFRLIVYGLPGLFGDWGEFAQKIIHDSFPLQATDTQ